MSQHLAASMQVVERTDLPRGTFYVLGRFLVVGAEPPSEVQRIVQEGVLAAHPWFRDPQDVMAILRRAAAAMPAVPWADLSEVTRDRT